MKTTRLDEELSYPDINEPRNINEVRKTEYSLQWKDAMDSEYDSLINSNTGESVPLPKDKNIVGSSLVFKVRRKVDGSTNRFKARLVAQGYSQSKGADYEEIFSPVVRYNSIRSLLAVANFCDWEVHQWMSRQVFYKVTLMKIST